MNDKEWLDKVVVAYKSYPKPFSDIKDFIIWLYKQYGIVQPKEGNK